ncbi:unnamed protein product [Adineta ricciae]|uniref:Uncharacterized protein n=1 Tax=Adineta ricciae TaxID=249248 RepID=A0A815BFL8_ADIRI|nr:unnamed protein product [Adineta ricciae]
MLTLLRGGTLLKRWWRLLLILLAPLILLPLPVVIKTVQARCAYIVILLTIYWVSEVMPYAVTSLLPLVFFPMGGVLPGDRVGLNYFKDITTMFVGIMILAYAMEHVRLHRRLALLVLKYVGASVTWSLAGLMGVTAFLSMWINNSASANIMIPTAIAIVNELKSYEQATKQTVATSKNKNEQNSSTIMLNDFKSESKNASSTDDNTTDQTFTLQIQHLIPINLKISQTTSTTNVLKQKNKHTLIPVFTGFLIAVVFSAAIGGMMTLVGTGPNIFVKGFSDQYYASGNIRLQISFANFLLYGLPIGMIMLVLGWLWLEILYNRKSFFQIKKLKIEVVESANNLQSILKQQQEELGVFSWREYIITILFVTVILLWITRDFSSYRGWDILFRKDYVTDRTTAMLIGCLPLILPDENPFSSKVSDWEYHPILKWNELAKAFPWSVFMLQGAGLAIADGFTASDLSSTIATFLHFIVGAPQAAIILIVTVISAVFTEFTSNLACASILFPILDSIAKTANIHPGRLILPSCMAVSLSFMLPIATPPNAMIFMNSNMRSRDLLVAGLGMKIIGIVVIFLVSLALLSPVFHISSIALISNSTLMTNVTSG